MVSILRVAARATSCSSDRSACTAAGGAWNASIVAEAATWGSTTLKADGLGAFIADVTKTGDTPMIIVSIGVNERDTFLFLFFLVVSVGMFLFRRRFRKRFEQHEKK